jgi:DNA helicase-2/ATP-dependent DNA helicase PcrA
MTNAANRVAGTDFDPALLAVEAEANGNSYVEYWAASMKATRNPTAVRMADFALGIIQSRSKWKPLAREALAWLPSTVGEAQGVVTDAADDKAAWEIAERAITAEKGGDIDLAKLLQGLAIRPKAAPSDPSAVTLLTIHAAKGLEFDYVWMVGMAETVLPSWQSLKSDARPAELEEERRNCFVGITRTRQNLVLCPAREYRGWKKEPSRFLAEMGLAE